MDQRILLANLKITKPIVIVGMMGSGKSTIGQKLAQKLKVDFEDTDCAIEQEQGKVISHIFSEQGEAFFRSLEKIKINELLEKEGGVISTGGGVVTTPENLRAIKDRAISVWLKSDIDTILDRLKGDDSRPLIQNDDPAKTLEHLLKEREPLYSKADIHINNNGDSEVVINEIVEKLGLKE